MPRKRVKIEDWETPQALLSLQSLAMRGLTQEQIAQTIGVPYRTFSRWKKKSAAIQKALATGLDAANAAVENALFLKAQNGDLGAICFWLKNRASDRWSEHPEIRGADSKVIFVDDIPRQQKLDPKEEAPSAPGPGAVGSAVGAGPERDQADGPDHP